MNMRSASPRRAQPGRRVPVALTIAGSDSGGGAGIQADLRVFARARVFGTTAVTAITAQNTRGVRRWCAVDPRLVRDQIDAVASDLRPRAVKSGMLANAAIVRAVASALRAHELAPYVLDPVITSSSGTSLLDGDGVIAMRRELLPLATLVTPNLDEATALTGEAVSDVRSMERAARALVEHGRARAALVTGGHLPGRTVVDVFYDGSGPPRRLRHRRIETRHTHGTGCTLSAAVTARLALGEQLRAAVRAAIIDVSRALRHPPRLGTGHGPVG
jgi:hydroxymethylpyrimidine/phosphomethylpyrimidine kinase